MCQDIATEYLPPHGLDAEGQIELQLEASQLEPGSVLVGNQARAEEASESDFTPAEDVPPECSQDEPIQERALRARIHQDLDVKRLVLQQEAKGHDWLSHSPVEIAIGKGPGKADLWHG